jgi:hypothetical protein
MEAGIGKGRAVEIVLDDGERRELTALSASTERRRRWLRARMVLAAADGFDNKAIAAKVGVCAATAGTWRNRFAQRRLDGLQD